ncbi:MAG: hypothetical protein LBL52_04565 [Rickettsiales bacterium]|jgi:hypothetical protein|nr:hypothetical protein [Rickettsiales bacterium]
MVVVEESFDFILGASGKVMLVLLAREYNPRGAFLVYDLRRGLALFRDNTEIVELSKVPRPVLGAIRRVPEVDVTEMTLGGRTVRQYHARVVLDQRLKPKLKKERRAPMGV